MVAVEYRVHMMVRGRFSGRYSPCTLVVRANSDKTALQAARRQARKHIGEPGQLIDLRTLSEHRAIAALAARERAS